VNRLTKKGYIAVGSFATAFVLVTLLVLPIFNGKSGFEQIQSLLKSSVDDDVVGVGDEGNGTEPLDDVELYTWEEHNYIGGISRWVLNESYVKQYLKDNFQWRLQASPNNDTWYDADQLLNVDLTWDENNFSYKVDLILDTHDAPQSLYYRFDMAVNKTLKEYTEICGYEWLLTIPGNDTRDVNVFFNWSDIKPLLQNNKVWFNRGVKNNFFWFRVQTVNKIDVDKIFVVDPAYGVIADAVVEEWEWDEQEGRSGNPRSMVKLGSSNYFASVANGDTGADNDGYIRVFEVLDVDGDITNSLIDNWEYDTDSGHYAGIIHISGDVYAVVYSDFGSSICKVWTTTIQESDGQCQEDTLDTISLTYNAGSHPNLINVDGDIYAVVYQEYVGGWDMQIETIEISSAGVIADSIIETVEFDSSSIGAKLDGVNCIMVDSDTIAIVYIDVDVDSWVITYDINGAGDISALVDSWEFLDGAHTSYSYSNIHLVTGNIFAITYADADRDGQIATVTISDAGSITNSFIDTLEFKDADTIFTNSVFTVADAGSYTYGVYGIYYRDVATDGHVSTVGIDSDGNINASLIDTIEFAPVRCDDYAPFIHVGGNYYFAVYEGALQDGYATTIDIETPVGGAPPENTAPIITGEAPVNQSTGISVSPTVYAIVTDADSDTMTCNFYTSPDNSAWTHQQTNSTVSTGTNISYIYSGASSYSTKYYWKVTADDGTDNTTSDIYEFTTEADTITFTEISFTPADILLTSTGNAVITYNISTGGTGLNATSIFFTHAMNSTSVINGCQTNTSYILEETDWLDDKYGAGSRNEDYWFEMFNASGTDELGYPGEWRVKNDTLTTGFVLNDMGDYYYNFTLTTSVENLFGKIMMGNPPLMRAEDKTGQTFDVYKDNIVKVAYNMSNTCFWNESQYNNTNYGFHINAAPSGATNKPLRVYFANDSYTGNPQISPYTELIAQVDTGDSYEISPLNSNYYHVSFSTDSDGNVGTVGMTENFSFVFETAQANAAAKWNIYYADDYVVHEGHVHDFYNNTCSYLSTDDGDTWANTDGIIDTFVVYADLENTSEIEYKLYAQMNGTATGSGSWSATQTELIDESNIAPNCPDIVTPNGTAPTDFYDVGDTINITYGWLGDPNHETCWVNITAYDNDTGLIAYYLQNRSITDAETHINNTWWYDWDTTGVNRGTYYINITATDPDSESCGANQNGTFNITFSWQDSFMWEMSASNTSAFQDSFMWEFSAGNTTTWEDSFMWEFSAKNTSARAWQDSFMWEMSARNTSTPQDMFMWEMSASNTSVSQDVFMWEFSARNTTSWIDAFMWEFSADSGTSWVDSFMWEFSAGNTTPWVDSFMWEFSAKNTSIRTWQDSFMWEFSASNTSTPTDSFMWEFSAKNTSARAWQDSFMWEMSARNTSTPQNSFMWEFSAGNTTASQDVFMWEFSARNTSADYWQDSFMWEMSASNTTPWSDYFMWEFSAKNSTATFITITDEYPSNTSTNIPLQPQVYATINSATGLTMNMSIYYGTKGNVNTLLTTHTNVANGTYNADYFTASNRTTTYYWRVQLNDGTNYLNETYNFTTEGFIIPKYPSNALAAAALMLAMMAVTFGVILFIRRKRKG